MRTTSLFLFASLGLASVAPAAPNATLITPVPTPAISRAATVQVRVAPDHRDWTYRPGEPVTFRVTVTADGLNRILASAGVTVSLPAVRIGPVDYCVYADTLQPARLRLTVTSTTIGSIDIDLVFSAYDRPVKIEAPPAGQVKGG